MKSFRFRSIATRFSHFEAKFLGKCEANYVPLSPLSLFNRAVSMYPESVAYVHGSQSKTWSEVNTRCRKYASALSALNVKRFDVVSVMASNTPLSLESHFGALSNGVVLHTVNIRLDAVQIAFQLQHADTKVLFVDSEFGQLAREAISLFRADSPKPIVIDVVDPEADEITGSLLAPATLDYEQFLDLGNESMDLIPPKDEWDACCVNYTSGTTGDPKGVVYHHRGAYLNSLANVIELNLQMHGSFLWVVPMFHCNGWSFPWGLAAVAGTSYLMRHVRPDAIFDITHKHNVQFICGAPITMNTMLNYKGRKFDHEVNMWVGGSPPPPLIMKRMKEELNVNVRTIYGLTETYGPVTSHRHDPTWEAPAGSDAALKLSTIQMPSIGMHQVKVMDPNTMVEVPADGKTLGEVMMRGNSIMKGYIRNESATYKTFEGGWLRTGDIAVNHGNNRFELKDRSKDIIISGGENISSVEVETIFLTHPVVQEAAVVAMPDEKWGEVPCIFLTVRPDVLPAHVPSPSEILHWARKHMAGFQTPKKAIFLEEMPKTATGKVQKHILRTMIN